MIGLPKNQVLSKKTRTGGPKMAKMKPGMKKMVDHPTAKKAMAQGGKPSAPANAGLSKLAKAPKKK